MRRTKKSVGKTDVDIFIFVWKNKKSPILAKSIGKFCFINKTKNSLSMSVFNFSSIFQILKTKFYAF